MTLFETFLEIFGGWSCAESCQIRNLPFISDIEIFMNKWNGDDERSDLWIPVTELRPEGAPIVFMYSESNNSFSYGHFTSSLADVPVTHWQPLVNPKRLQYIDR